MRISLFHLFIPLILGHLTVFGQEQSKDSVTYLEEVILGVAPDVSSPLGITPSDLLTENAIATQSPIDFAGTLNQIPGVYFLSGALNTNRITIRGVGARTPFGTDKLRMYYNDIPVTNGTGVSALEAFDLENLNTIRVVKGPKSGSYGAALGGAILLQSDIKKQEGTFLQNRSSFGSYGLFKNNLSLNHKGGKVQAEVRYNRMTTQGYRENNAFDRDGLLINLGLEAGDSHQLNLLVNYIDYTAEIPSSLGLTDYQTDPTQAAANWKEAKGFEANKYTLVGLSDEIHFNPGFKNTTSIFLSYLDHYEPRPFNILDEFTLGYGARSIFSVNLSGNSDKTRAVFGFESYRDEYNWSTFENLYRENEGLGSVQGDQLSRNKEFRNQFYAFGQLHWQVSTNLKAQVGLTLNKTTYDFRDQFREGDENRSATRDFDPILMPSLDLSYSLGPDSRIYLNISRGFSNPSLEESLAPDGVINPDISQEKGMNYEIGGTGYLFDRRLQGTLALYQMDIKDLLVAQRTGEDEFIGRNAGQTRHRGMEASLQYFMRPWNSWNVSPFLSYTLNNHSFVDFQTEDSDFSGNPLTGVPKHRIYGGLQINSDFGWFWNTSYQFVDAIPLTDSTSLYSDAYSLLNTQFGYRTQWDSRLNISLELGINNIFDTLYASSVLINATGFGGSEPRYYYPGNGRNYYVGILLLYAL
ncbi:MAG: TonB-dependent receptor [Robiginitalea sp.]|uniref:TonB-dependent receptor family protein n=1 Tax=Robiginitalea sp. TaxID=1902411 RepID=UPI003C79589E